MAIITFGFSSADSDFTGSCIMVGSSDAPLDTTATRSAHSTAAPAAPSARILASRFGRGFPGPSERLVRVREAGKEREREGGRKVSWREGLGGWESFTPPTPLPRGAAGVETPSGSRKNQKVGHY